MVYQKHRLAKRDAQLLLLVWQWCHSEITSAQLDEKHITDPRFSARAEWADEIPSGVHVLLGPGVHPQSQKIWLIETIKQRNWNGNKRSFERQKQTCVKIDNVVAEPGRLYSKMQPLQDSDKQLHFHWYGRFERVAVSSESWDCADTDQWLWVDDKWDIEIVWVLSESWFWNKPRTRNLSLQHIPLRKCYLRQQNPSYDIHQQWSLWWNKLIYCPWFLAQNQIILLWQFRWVLYTQLYPCFRRFTSHLRSFPKIDDDI